MRRSIDSEEEEKEEREEKEEEREEKDRIGGVATQRRKMKKPFNILFITSDQQRGDCYGFEKRKVKTPHLDELASEGTIFKNCIMNNYT